MVAMHRCLDFTSQPLNEWAIAGGFIIFFINTQYRHIQLLFNTFFPTNNNKYGDDAKHSDYIQQISLQNCNEALTLFSNIKHQKYVAYVHFERIRN
jgi:hypothetical protein